MPWTLVFILTIYLPLLGVSIYVGRKILDAVVTLRSWRRAAVRTVLICVLTFVNLLPIVFFVAFQIEGRSVVPAFAGDNVLIDLLLTYPFWIALVINIQLFVVYALADVIKFWVLRFFPGALEWWKGREARFVVIWFGVVVLYSGFTIYSDTWTVQIVEREVSIPKSLSSLDGFRIVQVSDVQGDGRTTNQKLRRFVQRVNALEPDLILFAGDVVTSGTSYIDSAVSILGELRSRYGTIAAVGDHDIFTSKSRVLGGLLRNGVRVVEDTTLFLNVGSARLPISVVTYTYPQRPMRDRLERLASDMGDPFKIFLVHQPAEDLVEFARSKGYDLFLAGHTHGGGIAFGIPGLGVLAPAHFESRYVSGFYTVGSMLVSVTNGLGFTLAPIRFHAPAQIMLIMLRA